MYLRTTRRRFAGAERGTRISQMRLNVHCDRMRAPKDAIRDPSNFLERRHGLAEIVERGAGVFVERQPVSPPDLERESILISENASRSGRHFAHQCLGFVEALRRELYAKRHLFSRTDQVLTMVNNLATALKAEGLYTEAKRILHKSIPDARRALGAEHDLTLNFRKMYADCLCLDSSPSRGDVAEAVAIYEDVHRARGVCSATGIQVGMTFHDVWTLRE